MQILSQGKYLDVEISNLIELINKYPKEESNYVSLIFLYSKSDNVAKLIETAQKLEAAIPNSEWAQVSLFKNHLDKNDGAKAVKSMNIVLKSSKIDSKIKHRILNEFLIYTTKNPEFTADLEEAINYFDNDPEINVSKEIGKFFHSKNQWDKAVKYYEKANSKNPNLELDTNILLLQVYTERKEFDKVQKKATECMEVFPSQPQFYYYLGLAYNQLTQFDKAKDILEMGLDYLIDDHTLEINFNIQLGEAYNGLGDLKKRDYYFSKSNQLLKK
jgi:tetratricopeptide (TPR) repeat protein